ncbi:MAG: hypothetical protein NZ570_01570 [Candidatus Caldarchaeum sp.]|nr:hypothetical protein [Candidatus Caldarchaeum sp.]
MVVSETVPVVGALFGQVAADHTSIYVASVVNSDKPVGVAVQPAGPTHLKLKTTRRNTPEKIPRKGHGSTITSEKYKIISTATRLRHSAQSSREQQL